MGEKVNQEIENWWIKTALVMKTGFWSAYADTTCLNDPTHRDWVHVSGSTFSMKEDNMQDHGFLPKVKVILQQYFVHSRNPLLPDSVTTIAGYTKEWNLKE